MKKKRDNKLYLVACLCIGAFVIVLVVFGMADRSSVSEVVSLQLSGSDTLHLYVGEEYNEPGFIAEGDVSGDLNDFVTVTNNVNTKYPGIYEVNYKLSYNGAVLEKIRKVKVINKPVISEGSSNDKIDNKNPSSGENDSLKVDTTDRIKIKLKGYSHVYIIKGSNFVDEGAIATTDSGKDVTNTIVVSGSVDSNKVGSYTLEYKVTDSAGSSAKVKRVVDVMEMGISATVSSNSLTNKSVIIKVVATADKFSHMIMPDGIKNKSNVGEYIAQDNGEYSFEVVNGYGLSTKYTYLINNIDKVAPIGSCSGYTTGKKSVITVDASDKNGISSYMVEGNSYTNNVIELNEVIPNPTVTIYDKVGNSKAVSCNLENRYTYVPSDPSIKYTYKYVNDGSTMPYAAYIPSTVSDEEELPLLVWLHGSGEVGTGEATFKKAGLPAILNTWKLDGFNAYVICPHLTGRYSGSWSNTTALANLNAVVDKFISENKVDKDKIMLSGHSLGGLGSMYIAYHSQGRYSALAVMSGYNPGVDLNGITIPTVGYVGTPGGGEDTNSYNFMVSKFKTKFGDANTFVRNTTHGNIPRVAYTEDANKDNKSDLMEWMLRQ